MQRKNVASSGIRSKGPGRRSGKDSVPIENPPQKLQGRFGCYLCTALHVRNATYAVFDG